MLSNYTVTQRREVQGEEQKQGMTWSGLSQFLVTELFIALPRSTELELSGVRGHSGSLRPLASPEKERFKSVPSCSDLQRGQRGVGAEDIPSILLHGKRAVVEVHQGYIFVPGLGTDCS